DRAGACRQTLHGRRMDRPLRALMSIREMILFVRRRNGTRWRRSLGIAVGATVAAAAAIHIRALSERMSLSAGFPAHARAWERLASVLLADTMDQDRGPPPPSLTRRGRSSIPSATSVPAGGFTVPGARGSAPPTLPAFCRVTAILRPTPESNI